MPLDPRASDEPLWGAPLAFLDFETTWEGDGGRDDPGQHVVQVGVVQWSLGSKRPPHIAVDQLVRPPVPIRPEAMACHGISDADVSAAPPWEEVGEAVRRALSGHVLVAFNLPYDWTVYELSNSRFGPEVSAFMHVPFRGLDPLVWARALPFKLGDKQSLRDVARHLGIPTSGLHRAARDALLTAEVSVPLLRRIREHGVELDTLRDAWEMTVREALAWEVRMRDWHSKRSRPFDMPWHKLTEAT